jgi:hypothetical protein
MITENPIRHILLIPPEGDPHGLLREGPCSASPPTASWGDDRPARHPSEPDTFEPRWIGGGEGFGRYVTRKGEQWTALVLAWDGARVLSGVLAAEIALYGDNEGQSIGVSCPSSDEALRLGRYYESQGLGRLVVVRA